MIRALILASLVLVTAACNSKGDSSSNGEGRAAGVRDAAVEAMQGPSSYAATMELGEGPPIEWEFVAPDTYRITTSEDEGTGEALYVDNTIYTRACGTGRECGAWELQPRGDVIAGALSPSYFPQWPLVALEMASDIKYLDGSAESSSIVLRGSQNHIRAIFENVRRLSEAAGLPFDLDERLQEEDDTAYYDEHPADMRWWIDPATMRVQLAEVLVPDQDGGAPINITVTYTRFDEVAVEAPP